MDGSINIDNVLSNMSRTIFASEADFKFTLAQTIKEMYEKAIVICEYVPDYDSGVESMGKTKEKYESNFIEKKSRIHIDILVLYDGKRIPIELKYRTKKIEKDEKINHEVPIKISLTNQDAYDSGCYGFVRDMCRIAEFLGINKCDNSVGYAIFLSNDDKYQKSKDDRCNYINFWINNLKENKNMEQLKGRVDGRNRKLNYNNEFSFSIEEWTKLENSELFYTVATIQKSEK